MTLIKKPVRPKRHPLIVARLGQDKYQSWKAFLDEAYWNVELKEAILTVRNMPPLFGVYFA